MTAKHPIPRVSVRLSRNGQLEFLVGYLIRTPDGRYWAFPDEESAERDPYVAGAIPLDVLHLEEQPQPPDALRLFVYRATVHIPQ